MINPNLTYTESRKRDILRFFAALIVATVAVVLMAAPKDSKAATAADLDRESAESLSTLYKTNALAQDVAKQAKAVLVFPKIMKAGLIFGGAYGEGELIQGGAVADYYNSLTGSWGLQAGAQSYGYVVYLMTDKAVKYLKDTKGWEVGVGPTMVIVDEGVAKNLSSSTLKDDAYAFIFDQKGIMAGVSIEGTKITKINR